MLNLKQLETFVCIANLGSFRQTAEQLCTTQPAISTRIVNLEHALNTVLFHREGGKVSLTAKGRELLPLAEGIVSGSQNLLQKANREIDLSGLLKIGVSETLVHTWLPNFLEQLHQLLPQVEVELSVDATVNLTKDLLARNLDIAMMMGPVNEPSAVNKPLSSYELFWVARPDIAEQIEHKVSNFVSWPIITYGRNTSPYHEIAHYFKLNNIHNIRFYSSASLSASLKLVENGVGIASLPKEVVQQQLANGQLAVINADWQPNPLNFTVTYLSSSESIRNNTLINQAVDMALTVANTKASSMR
jgi:DNA-binding transcriptional LysR family regulator